MIISTLWTGGLSRHHAEDHPSPGWGERL